MTIAEVWYTYGNLVTLFGAAILGYVVWRERAMSEIKQLKASLERAHEDIDGLKTELSARRDDRMNVAASLSSINTQLGHITETVNEIKQELKLKVDKE